MKKLRYEHHKKRSGNRLQYIITSDTKTINFQFIHHQYICVGKLHFLLLFHVSSGRHTPYGDSQIANLDVISSVLIYSICGLPQQVFKPCRNLRYSVKTTNELSPSRRLKTFYIFVFPPYLWPRTRKQCVTRHLHVLKLYFDGKSAFTTHPRHKNYPINSTRVVPGT